MNKSKIKVEALNDHNYDGISRQAGKQYEIDPKDLHLMMTVLGMVKVITDPAEPVKEPVKEPLKVQVKEPAVRPVKASETSERKPIEGQYNRRDLRARED